MADTVVGSVAVKQIGGGISSDTPIGVDAENVYCVSTDGNTYTAKDIINWMEDYVYDNAKTFIGSSNPVSGGVPTANVGLFIDKSVSAKSLING